MSEDLTGPEIELKMQLIKSTSDAIVRAKQTLAEKKDAYSLADLQYLERRRAEMRGTLPRLRVVT